MIFLSSCFGSDADIQFRSIDLNLSQPAADTIDIDGDGNADLLFRLYDEIDTSGTNINTIDVVGLNGTQILSTVQIISIPGTPLAFPFYSPSRLNFGSPIDASQSLYVDTSFITAQGNLSGIPVEENKWIDSNAYFGFSIQVDGQTHYGWFMMAAQNYFELRLVGYAWDTTPNEGIFAGIR